MKTIFVPLRRVPLIAAAGLVASIFTLVGTATAAASSCPTVDSNGTVTPAPAPGVDWAGCVVRDANLSGADLSRANLSNAGFSYANLSGANLTDANLDGASLAQSTLTGVTLAGATMSSTTDFLYVTSGQIIGKPVVPAGFDWRVQDGYLIGPYADLRDADLSGADLSGANLYGAWLQSAHLAGANLTGADFEASSLSGADLTGADLTNARLVNGTDLSNAILTGTTLTGATLRGAPTDTSTQLDGVVSGGIVGRPASLPTYWVLAGGYLAGPGANLTGADLAGLDLSGARLGGVNLTNANLSGANLQGDPFGGDLSGTRLQGADLDRIQPLPSTGQPASLPTSDWHYVAGYLLGPGVDLKAYNLSSDDLAGVDLSGASLYKASLTQADLDGANLSETNLWDANLTSATAKGTDFAGAAWYSTTCPDGTDSNLYVDGCFSARATTHVTGTRAKCVDDWYGGTTGGNKIDLYTCTGESPQIVTYTDGQLRVRNGCITGGAIDVYYYLCTHSTNKTWTRAGNEYVNQATGKCLTDPGNSSTNGTQLVVAACANSVDQSWTLPSAVPTGPVIGTWAKCVDDRYGGTTDGNKIDLYTCTGGAPQVITYTSGQLQVRGGCLTGGSLDVYYYPCTTVTNKTWTRVGNEYVNKWTGKCLTDPGNSGTNGTQLVVAACVNTVNQRWTLP